jgi:hypothetical protein
MPRAPIEAAGAAAAADQGAADHAHLECEFALATDATVWSFQQREGASTNP